MVRIFDGDTLEVLVGSRTDRVRLAGIDTPERGQPWAERSKQALAGRVFGKEVRINRVATDRYGRTVGEVYADDVRLRQLLHNLIRNSIEATEGMKPGLLQAEHARQATRTKSAWSAEEVRVSGPEH